MHFSKQISAKFDIILLYNNIVRKTARNMRKISTKIKGKLVKIVDKLFLIS